MVYFISLNSDLNMGEGGTGSQASPLHQCILQVFKSLTSYRTLIQVNHLEVFTAIARCPYQVSHCLGSLVLNAIALEG